MSGLGDAVDALFRMIAIILVVCVPLAIWKLIDIGIWIFHHVSVGIK